MEHGHSAGSDASSTEPTGAARKGTAALVRLSGSRWPAVAAVCAALALQFRLDERLSIGPSWALPTIEGLLLAMLVGTDPSMSTPRSRHGRVASLGLIGMLSITNLTSLGLLIHQLLKGRSGISGRPLIYSAVMIWFTGVLAYGLWFWELDRGGPASRCNAQQQHPDFLFPQMDNPALHDGTWSPSFLDYLYLSLTNSTAFSPTDVLPLTVRVKILMATQAVGSLATVALVGARAVNILM